MPSGMARSPLQDVASQIACAELDTNQLLWVSLPLTTIPYTVNDRSPVGLVSHACLDLPLTCSVAVSIRRACRIKRPRRSLDAYRSDAARATAGTAAWWR